MLGFEIMHLVIYGSTFQGILGASAELRLTSLVWPATIRGFPPDSIKAHDIERLRCLLHGIIVRNPDNHLVIMDVRYSHVSNEFSPLWVIRLEPEESWQHTDYLNTRDVTFRSRQRFLEMLF